MCNLPTAPFADPNQALGERLGMKAPGPTLTPQQAAIQLRDQVVEQVKAMVKAFLFTKQRERPLSLLLPLLFVCSRK